MACGTEIFDFLKLIKESFREEGKEEERERRREIFQLLLGLGFRRVLPQKFAYSSESHHAYN